MRSSCPLSPLESEQFEIVKTVLAPAVREAEAVQVKGPATVMAHNAPLTGTGPEVKAGVMVTALRVVVTAAPIVP
jgi:hypothetical protein